MLLIQRLVSDAPVRPPQAQVRLMAERRMFLKRRWRGTAEDGQEFGFDLESRLHSGALIYQSDSADYVIFQQPETVFELAWQVPAEAALMGWKFGNLHFPVEIGSGWLRVARDPAVEQLAAREGWILTETEVVFNPLRVTPHAG